jgi:hypothetical protein
METIKSLAREIARAYGGKMKRDELGVLGMPVCYFVVKASHRGRPLTFRVFDGGCVVEGATTWKPAVGVCWNRPMERIDRPVKGALPKDAMSVFHAMYLKGGKELPPPGLETLRHELRTIWKDDQSREALLALRLKGNEFLVHLTKPMFSDGRPHFYLVHHSTDLSELSRRLDVMAELFPPVRGGADVAKQVSDRAHRIKIGAAKKGVTSASRHRFGGSLETALICENCRTPIHLILTIDTSDKALRLPKLGRPSLPIVYCLNCMSWDPLYVDYSADALRIVRQSKAEKVNDDAALEERAVSLVPLASPKTSASKVGGSPTWLQGPAIPDCIGCKEPMTFFGQLKSLPTLSFGDDGVLYSFVCPDCKVSATLIQSH